MLEDHNTTYIDVIVKTIFKNEDHNAKYIEVIAKTIFKNGSIFTLVRMSKLHNICSLFRVTSFISVLVRKSIHS